MKHILMIANIDGQSHQLLRYAAKLCKDLDLRLHIIQIEAKSEPIFISSPYYMSKSGVIFNFENQNKKRVLTQYVMEHTKDLISTDWISLKLTTGTIQDSLSTFINKEKIDLILVSQSVFRNSNIRQNNAFAKVLFNIVDIPTLVVPSDHPYATYKYIGYLTTLKGNDHINLMWVKNNFPKSETKVLHFALGDISIQEQKKISYLKSELGEHKFTFENRTIDIKDFVTSETKTVENEFDCLIVKTKKRNFWQRLIDPSDALNIILRIDIPTLIFKYREEELKT